MFESWELAGIEGVLEVTGEDHIPLDDTCDVKEEEGEDGESLYSRGYDVPPNLL